MAVLAVSEAMEVRGVKTRRALVVLVLLVAGSWGVWPAAGPVTAQDDVPAAALVEGSCDDVGETVADLNELRIRDEGEVLASFTTIDLALDDILADPHALVLNLDGDVVACGDFEGSGDDVYSGIAATTDDGWGGIAWLHAREDGTQVTLFVAQGLSAGAVPPVEPTEEGPIPPEEETPVPPDEGTPEVRATRTPRPNPTSTPDSPDTLTTYESPSYGYTLAYDPAIWEKLQEITQPGGDGSLDILELGSTNSLVSLVGELGAEGFDAIDLCEARLRQYSGDPQISGLAVLEPTDGDESHAVVVFDYTFNTDDGNAYDWRVWIDCYNSPDNTALLSVFFSAVQGVADGEEPLREALLDGLTFPGE